MIRKAVPDSPWTSIIDSDDFDKTVGVTITAPASMQAKIANTIEQILVDSQVQISVETRVFELPTKDLKRISFALPIDVNGAQLTPLLVSEKQIQELIGAVQADMAATSVTAPRLTLFNHQSGKIVVSTVQSYVADFTSTKLPNGDVRYDPKVATVPQMATIEEIRAATSESQLTDTLDLHVKFSRLVSLDTTTYRGHEDLHIQVPKEFVSEITGRFAVPDGQNMLFAGGLDKGSDKRALILIKAMVLHPQAGVMKREFPLLP